MSPGPGYWPPELRKQVIVAAKDVADRYIPLHVPALARISPEHRGVALERMTRRGGGPSLSELLVDRVTMLIGDLHGPLGRQEVLEAAQEGALIAMWVVSDRLRLALAQHAGHLPRTGARREGSLGSVLSHARRPPDTDGSSAEGSAACEPP
jgi:hypothetical protein